VIVRVEVPLPVSELTVRVREASVPPPKEMFLLGTTDRLEEVALEGVMNFNPEAVASWHGDSKTIPK
jgi:hypothetical protein